MTVSERTQLEIERGRERGRQAERCAYLQRLEKGKKISLRYDIDGFRRQVWVYKDPDRNGIKDFPMMPDEMICEEPEGNDYPSEVLVAKVALYIQACADMEGVPDTVQTEQERRVARDLLQHRKDYRDKYVHNWSQGEP